MQIDPDIVEMPQPLGLYAGALFKRGVEYLGAFRQFASDDNVKAFPHPTYYLLSHSLELFLKSFLAANGFSKKALMDKRIRHSVLKLLHLCQNKGMGAINQIEDLCSTLQEMNADYDFRYPTSYKIELPRAELCLPIMDALHAQLNPMISQVVIDAQLQFASDTRHLRSKKIRWSD